MKLQEIIRNMGSYVNTDTATRSPAGVVSLPGRDYYELFREYPEKEKILDEVQNALWEGIRLFAGKRCHDQCRESGLSSLHRYYPHQGVNLLQTYVNKRVSRSMIRWSARIGREMLGMQEDFFVQDLLVVRIHYPHGEPVAEESSVKRPSWLLRMRYGHGATIESIKAAAGSRFGWRRSKEVGEYLKRRRKRGSVHPLAYRCHAPHLDSWLGQPIGALSVWLAIAGVERDSSMCLYPDTVDVRLPQGPSRFLGSGFLLSKPMRPDIEDGDLFIFSTDILHSSQLNISGKTRIALTTRISFGRPEYDCHNLWFIERWRSANDLLEGRNRLAMILASEHSIERKFDEVPTRATPCVRINSNHTQGEQYVIAPSSGLKHGEKIAVQFSNRRMIVVRTAQGLRAFSAICPHEGYRIDDGYNDDQTLVCPGHGLEFDCDTGQSKLARFKLRRFDVTERDGQIIVGSD